MINELFERIEKSLSPLEVEHKQAESEHLQRTIMGGRSRFQIVIRNLEETVKVINDHESLEEYEPVALGSYEDPVQPDRSNQLLATPYVYARDQDQRIVNLYGHHLNSEYGIVLEGVNSEGGPNQKVRRFGTFIISATDSLPSLNSTAQPITLQQAVDFRDLAIALLDRINQRVDT